MKPSHRPIHQRIRYLLQEGFTLTARAMDNGTLYVFAFQTLSARQKLNAWLDEQVRKGEVRNNEELWHRAWHQFEGAHKHGFMLSDMAEAEEIIDEAARYAATSKGKRS